MAIGLICDRLGGGHIVGLDRSPKMIAAATDRNAAHVSAGRARFVTAELDEADLGGERFDKVVAIRFPPLLRGRTGLALDAVRKHLTEGGGLYVIEHPFPGTRGQDVADALAASLEQRGFAVRSVVVEEGAQPALCLIAG